MSNKQYSYDGLDDKLIQAAKKECNEDPKQIQPHIESLRRWVSSTRHLKCPTDDEFLIKFLRVAKYDHHKAEQRLDNFCTSRASERGSSFWFPKDFRMDDPLIEQFLKTEMQTPLGVTENGTMVVLIRPKLWNPDEMPLKRMGIPTFMGMDHCIQSQEAQIKGVVSIIDLEGTGKKQFMAWCDGDLMKNWAQTFQDAYPMRQTGLIYFKEPPMLDMMMGFIEFFLKDKIKKRLYRVKDNLKKLHEKLPGAEAILPTEYGGKAGSFADVRAKYVKEFREFIANGRPYSDIEVNEKERPTTTMNFLKQYGDFKGDLNFGETKGTYTKLNV